MAEKPKKKILLIANDTTYIYNLRNEVIERLVSEGYEVVTVSKILNFCEELGRMGCRVINVETDRHGTSPLADARLLLKYRQIIKDEKPSIVLTYNIKPNVYGGIACRLAHIPYLPNITGLGTAVEYPGPLQKLSLILYRSGLKGAACVFFQNEANREFFRNHRVLKTESRTRLLPGSGVSLKLHKETEYPEDDHTIEFLFVARIMKEKGIDLYLNAANRVHSDFGNVIFHICGRCDDEKYIQLLEDASKNEYIQYHGEQKNMIPFFEKVHCIVHPSYYPEGMSNVLLEAAAHCRPIITTDRAGCKETVDDGKTGYIIPVKDENALVQALENFIVLDYETKRAMGFAGRKKIEKEFDRQIVAQAYIEEIRRIIG